MKDSSQDAASQVLGLIPSGCAIVTARHANRSTGMLASWIQQAALEPLLLTIAIKDGRPILELLNESNRFVLNLIGADPQPMFKHFGQGFSIGQPAFEGLRTRESDYGVILEETLGYLQCTVESKTRAGDHWIYVARPVSGQIQTTCEPYIRIRKSAANY